MGRAPYMAIDPAKPYDLTFTPDASEMGRLDRFLKLRIPSMSRTRIQQRIREGRVAVDGVERPANWIVRPGDAVLVRCPPPSDAEAVTRAIPLVFLYEDARMAALDKPAGYVIHPVGVHRHDTLLNALYAHYKNRLPPGGDLSLVNRLDQYTSGVFLVALDADAKRFLQDEFESRRPKKRYVALCRGWPDPPEGVIDLPLGPDPVADDHCRRAVRRDAEGKPSVTRYRVLETFLLPAAGPYPPPEAERRLAWVELEPLTGRQHQLRVHLAALGHPLLADARYGDGKALVRAPDEGEGGGALVDRYALHAAYTECRHPDDGRTMTFEAPPAPDLRAALEALRAGEPLRLWRL